MFRMEVRTTFTLRSCPYSFAAWRTANTLFALLLGVASLPAHSQTKPAPKPPPRMVEAVNQTAVHGHDATLPPHISHLLGISPEEKEVPVKQFVEITEPVRGFDVSTAEHNDIVIFVENRVAKESTFYLTSRRGVLRKVLSIREGVGYDRAPTAADKEAFEVQKQYWLDQLAPIKSGKSDPSPR